MNQTMQSLSSSVLLPDLRCRKIGLLHRCNRNTVLKVSAMRRDDYGAGKLVDENMMVLRKRIREIVNEEAPEDWMEWEKKYYPYYDSDVCEALGFIQTQLMKTRPSIALGMLALVMVSVPTSMFMLAFHLVKIVKWILSAGIPLS